MPRADRNIPYRPPRRTYQGPEQGSWTLYSRFLGRYLAPHRWALVLCLFFVSVNRSAIYVLAFFGRYVVDEVLVLGPQPEEAVRAPRFDRPSRRDEAGRPRWADDRKQGNRPRSSLHRTRAVPRRPPGAGRRLLILFLLQAACFLVLNLTVRLAHRARIRIGQDMAARLREDLHEKLLDLSLRYHQSTTPGRLLARVMSDVQMVQNQFMDTLIQLVGSSMAVVIGFGILIVSEWRLAAVAALALPFYSMVFRRMRPGLKRLAMEMRHTNSCLYGLVTQKFDAIKSVQAYGREKREALDFHRLCSCFMRDAMGQQRIMAFMHESAAIISAIATSAVFLLGISFVLERQMKPGEMLYLHAVTTSLFMPVLMLTNVSIVYTRLLVVLQRLADILDRPTEIEEAPDALPLPQPLCRGIRMQNVRFGYSEEQEPILRTISLRAPAGKWVCIMGASGAGKTTLLHVLARLYEPDDGHATVDGIPLSRVRVSDLRRRLALVPQEAQIFRGTVRDNIAYGNPDASPSEIMAAAKAAEMHDLIMDMPVQYETLVGEKGISLSGGQRQRLSLARALLTNPDVLLLDDCTSALDAATERRIQETLQRIMIGKTAVIVSQRVSMAMRCHHIYVIAGGIVSESGTHEQLLARNGFYAQLHAQQTEA